MLVRSLASDAVVDVDDEVGAEMLKKGWVSAGSSPKKVEPKPEPEADAPVKRAPRKAAHPKG